MAIKRRGKEFHKWRWAAMWGSARIAERMAEWSILNDKKRNVLQKKRRKNETNL